MLTFAVTKGLAEYSASWDELVAGLDPPSLGMRSWWLEGMATPDSRFLLVFDDARLVGGVPLEVSRRWATTFVSVFAGRQFGPLHVDAVAVDGMRDEVIATMSAWFQGHRNLSMSIGGVRPASMLAEAVPGDVHETPYGRAPVVVLPDDVEHFLAMRTANWRSSVKRDQARLAAAGYHYRVLDADEFDAGMAALRRLHSQRFGERSKFSPRFEQFHAAATAGSERGELRLHVIAREGHVVAVDALIEAGGYADYLQGGIDTTDRLYRGVGIVLLAGIIGQLISEGAKELDLETDANNYKLRLTDEVRHVVKLETEWGAIPPWIQRANRLRELSKRVVRGVGRRIQGRISFASTKDP